MKRAREQRFVEQDEALVTVAQFYDPMRAQIAKGLLIASGVECFLQGQNANQLLAPAFRARLKVMRADEATARELLSGAGDDEAILPVSLPSDPGPGE